MAPKAKKSNTLQAKQTKSTRSNTMKAVTSKSSMTEKEKDASIMHPDWKLGNGKTSDNFDTWVFMCMVFHNICSLVEMIVRRKEIGSVDWLEMLKAIEVYFDSMEQVGKNDENRGGRAKEIKEIQERLRTSIGELFSTWKNNTKMRGLKKIELESLEIWNIFFGQKGNNLCLSDEKIKTTKQKVENLRDFSKYFDIPKEGRLSLKWDKVITRAVTLPLMIHENAWCLKSYWMETLHFVPLMILLDSLEWSIMLDLISAFVFMKADWRPRVVIDGCSPLDHGRARVYHAIPNGPLVQAILFIETGQITTEEYSRDVNKIALCLLPEELQPELVAGPIRENDESSGRTIKETDEQYFKNQAERMIIQKKLADLSATNWEKELIDGNDE